MSNQILSNYYLSYSSHHAAESACQGIDLILARKQYGAFVPSMLLTGGSGSGKTTLIKHYIEKNALADKAIITRVRPNLKETLTWLTNELGSFKNHRANGSEQGLLDYTIRMIKSAKLELLIIEEAQELFECTSHKERQKIRDQLKMISDECRLPIIFVGMPSLKLLLEDSQWDRRIMIKRELPYVTITDKESMYSYMDLLKSLQKALPIPVIFDLDNEHMAFPLLACSSGILSHMKEILALGLKIALDRNADQITLDDFKGAYELIHPNTNENPFSISIENLKIKQIKRYDEYEYDKNGEILFHRQIFDEIKIEYLFK